MLLGEADSNSNNSVDDSKCECDATSADSTVAVGTEDRFRVDRRKLERLLQGIAISVFQKLSSSSIMKIYVFLSKSDVHIKSYSSKTPRFCHQLNCCILCLDNSIQFNVVADAGVASISASLIKRGIQLII